MRGDALSCQETRVKIYLKAGGLLKDKLHPDIDQYTRALKVTGSPTLAEILESIGIQPGLVAFAMVENRLCRLDYRPKDGEVLSLHPPVSGG
ncbi:MAG: MoaD/ThiS family protein [Bradymonadales bacterium]|nr:MoaD/ThiS family protein [Bradymonadales bacterium]